ncbi:MAG: hypothetical protein WC454_03360 [Phycisphaerae bacterium]|jgi:hypothetical protein
MKTKCVVILAALVIALGVVMTITGCCEKTKKCTKAQETKACEKAPAPAPAK